MHDLPLLAKLPKCTYCMPFDCPQVRRCTYRYAQNTLTPGHSIGLRMRAKEHLSENWPIGAEIRCYTAELKTEGRLESYPRPTLKSVGYSFVDCILPLNT